jgi:hypothetical protein
LLELNRAIQVCADRGEGLPLCVADPNQKDRAASELYDLAAIRLEVLYFSADASFTAALGDRGGFMKKNGRVQEGKEWRR